MDEKLNHDYVEAAEALEEEKLTKVKKILARMQKLAPDDPRTIEIAGDYARACNDLEKAEACYQRLDTFTDRPEIRGIGRMSLGFLYRDQDDYATAIEHLDAAIELFSEAEDLGQTLFCHGAQAEVLMQAGDYEQAADSLELIQKMIDQIGITEEYSGMATEVSQQRGDAYRLMGRLDDARKAYQQAIAIAEEFDMPEEQAASLDGLGVVCQVQGQYEEAKEFHLKSLALNEAIGSDEGRTVNLANLARLHIHLEQWDAAEQYARKALEIDTDAEDLNGIGFCQILLADIACGRQDFAGAEKILKQVQKIYERHGDAEDSLTLLSKLGYVYRRQNRLEEAEAMQTQVRAVCEAMGHADGLAATLDELAAIRVLQGNAEEARSFWQSSLSIYEELGATPLIEEIREKLAKLDAGT